MAIQATIKTDYLGNIPNCYIIFGIEKTKLLFDGIRIMSFVFSSQEKREAGIYMPLSISSIDIPRSSDAFLQYFDENFLKQNNTTDTEQAYLFMKNEKPECFIDFLTLIDC